MADRLRVAARIVCNAPEGLKALLQSEGAKEWREDLLKDLEVMREVLKSRLAALPPPRRSIRNWEDIWRSHPEAWKKLVSKFVGEVAKCESNFLTACARESLYRFHPTSPEAGRG